MDVQLQSALRKIDTLILDVDHVIHHYDDAYARAFSTATACSFGKLYPELQQTKINYALVDREKTGTHFFWINFAVDSYHKRGRTTALFKEQFSEIDEMGLYVHHHDSLCKENGVVHQYFQKGSIPIDQNLPHLLEQVKQLGVKIVAVTNGTQGYAEMVLGMRGHNIAHLFDRLMGIDSVDNPYLYDKRHGDFINDVLDELDVLKEFNNAVGSDVDGFDHSNIALIDDTPRNLRAPRKMFNMHTTLKLTDTNRDQMENASHSVEDVKDLLNQIIEAKSQTMPHLR
jgi:FMN phosphatase YigB (HAD superfamily)